MSALITVSELKEFISVRDGVTKFDTKLQAVIVGATAMIEQACRRSFAKKDRVERFAPSNSYGSGVDLYGTSLTGLNTYVKSQRITLAGLSVDTTKALDIRYDVRAVFGDDTVIDPVNYTLVDPDKGIIDLRYPTRHATAALRVSYNAGWSESADAFPTMSASAPADVKLACQLQAMFLWNRFDPNTLGMTSDNDAKSPSNTFVVKGGVVPDAAVLLAPYRRVLTGGA
jgi:hypothetical protein